MKNQKMALRDKLTLFLMVTMSFFLMCDMYITPALVSPLAIEYGVSKESLGWVGSSFVLVGAMVSIFFGYLTDKVSRKNLLVLTVLIGEIPCLLTGFHLFTSSYSGFLIMRIMTGIGVGGIYPLTYSLVSDYFTDRHRATASACIDIAWAIGMITGPLLAGYALETAYGWRLAFIIAAVPNFPIALVFGLYATNPQRGRSEAALAQALNEGATYHHRISLADFKLVFQNKTNLLLFMQGIPGCIPWGLMTFWIITFYQEAKGLSLGDSTMIWELFGIGAALGGITWALLGDKLFRKDPRYLPLLCSTGVFVGVIPCFLIINLPISSISVYLSMAILAGVLIAVPASNVKAMLMNVNRPEHRGSVFAVFNITDSLGKGIGPALGGIILGATGNYYTMMNFAISSWILCSLIFSGIFFTIAHDRKNMLKLLETRAAEMATPDSRIPH